MSTQGVLCPKCHTGFYPKGLSPRCPACGYRLSPARKEQANPSQDAVKADAFQRAAAAAEQKYAALWAAEARETERAAAEQTYAEAEVGISGFIFSFILGIGVGLALPLVLAVLVLAVYWGGVCSVDHPNPGTCTDSVFRTIVTIALFVSVPLSAGTGFVATELHLARTTSVPAFAAAAAVATALALLVGFVAWQPDAADMWRILCGKGDICDLSSDGHP